MDIIRIKPSALSGKIAIPPSKSHTLRAILFASLADGTSIIHNYLDSADTHAMIHACQLLGAEIQCCKDSLAIKGIKGKVGKAHDVIQSGNSGIVLRFLSAIAGLSSFPIVITGDHSIRYQRPMKTTLSALQQLGCHAVSTKDDGFAPIIVQGPWKGGKVFVDGADSQPISALLIAGSLAVKSTELIVSNPGEKPWIEFTLEWLQQLGICIEHQNYSYFYIRGNASIKAFTYKVPGDFSSAAFPMAAALVTHSTITLENLNMNDFQGDKKLISILQQMGANIDQTFQGIHIKGNSNLRGIEIDINDFIDALPILAVLGCFAEGKTIIRNGKVARQKECDRIRCIAAELRKMGAKIEELDDGLVVERSVLKGTVLDGCSDHRLCMALAVAGLGCQEESTIASAMSIKKTYPSFVQDFQSINAEITFV